MPSISQNDKESTITMPQAFWLDEALTRSVSKLRRTSRRIKDSFPHVSKAGRYDDAALDWWTNGFWPGILWLLYRETHEEEFRLTAESCERKLDQVLHAFDGLHHDVGFMWIPSSVARYSLLGSEDSRQRALLAASTLAARFNLQGKFIRAWNQDKVGWVIIDCMMNLPLLFWASEVLKDPRFCYIAKAHADTMLSHAVDPDGSCRHIMSFDPHGGSYIEALGGQGYSPSSAWSRGAAWALYGFALCFRYTRETRYLHCSQRVADYFLSQLGADYIPAWDFRSDAESRKVKDSSAGACAACGLLELAAHCETSKSSHYRQAAEAILRSLDQRCGAWDRDEEGLLLFATGNKAAELNVQVPLIYGDYFFLEGLCRLRTGRGGFW